MKQQRSTRQRQLVLDAVRSRCDHPTADEIYIDVRASDSKISRGTVYRNLAFLSDAGEILHVKVPGADRYDLRREPHYHLLCTSCGAVSDLPLPYDPAMDKQVSRATGYEIARHRTIFEGVCPSCAGKQKAGE